MAEHYTTVRCLGEGSFGKCFLVRADSDGALMVIKQIALTSLSRQEQSDTLRESKILEKLDHPNIIKFREVYKTKHNRLCIVMEYADGGDLATKIQNQRGVHLDEGTVLDYFVQICLAMKHVHDRKILHRDLKSHNIFLTKSGRIKLGDFGIAKVLQNTFDQARTMVGTPYYLSPEIVRNESYSFKSDIWSLGVLLYEMCALQPPFQGQSIHNLALNIIAGKYPPLPRSYSAGLSDLVAKLLSLNAAERPTIHELIWMPIIQSRATAFLTNTMRNVEFSHTVLHGANILERKPTGSPDSARSPMTPAQNQEFMAKLEEAKVADDKRRILAEDVKERQKVHTLRKDEFAAVAQKVAESLKTEEEKKQQKEQVEVEINKLESQALIYHLQLALVEHPSEAAIVEIAEPNSPFTDREDELPDAANTAAASRDPMRVTSGISRIEGMRSLLEDRLGTGNFVKAYQIIKGINETVPEDQITPDLFYQKLRSLMTYDDVETIVPQIGVLMDLEKEAGIYV